MNVKINQQLQYKPIYHITKALSLSLIALICISLFVFDDSIFKDLPTETLKILSVVTFTMFGWTVLMDYATVPTKKSVFTRYSTEGSTI